MNCHVYPIVLVVLYLGIIEYHVSACQFQYISSKKDLPYYPSNRSGVRNTGSVCRKSFQPKIKIDKIWVLFIMNFLGLSPYM